MIRDPDGVDRDGNGKAMSASGEAGTEADRLALRPDENGFRYVLMWMTHILNNGDRTADATFITEWSDFVQQCQQSITDLERRAVEAEAINDQLAGMLNDNKAALDAALSEAAALKHDMERLHDSLTQEANARIAAESEAAAMREAKKCEGVAIAAVLKEFADLSGALPYNTLYGRLINAIDRARAVGKGGT